jgi:hypothetical protein
MERVPAMPGKRCGLGLNAANAFAPGELDEARRSLRVLASPISFGTHNRAEVAPLGRARDSGPLSHGRHRRLPLKVN